MGAYQSSPKTETDPLDVSDVRMLCGANAMQGWRLSQEDAHNVVLSFDGDPRKALFAVYDGHGGAEVAKYCADFFPDFLRAHPLFLQREFEKCLAPAFLAFDGTLVEPEVSLESE
jgi:protein phosphatase 1G